MDERLLQYIWQFQYFNKRSLFTTAAQPLQIINKGNWNHDQGPDFLFARIRIGETTWVGNIELHVRSSDWFRHGHGNDQHYANVILHVVWENDKPVIDQFGKEIPTLVLEPLVPFLLQERYLQMVNNMQLVACNDHLPVLEELAWYAWKERLALERLERKTAKLLQQYETLGGNWDEVWWRQLAAAFGTPVNTDLFEWVQGSCGIQVLSRCNNQPDQLEALLMGQANLLEKQFTDVYPKHLQKEYRYFLHKYQLPRTGIMPSFLRMRPASFPTIRLSQLAMLRHRHIGLPVLLREANGLKEAMALFQVKASIYWNDHYLFDEQALPSPKFIGRQMCTHLFINAVIPLLFVYGHHQGRQVLKDKAIQWLYTLPPEQNKYTRYWQARGISNHTALDSQALLELNTQYCVNKKCLDCAVGNKLIR